MKAFSELFAGLDRSHGKYILEDSIPGKTKREGKATTVHEPVTPELYDKHISGDLGLGIVPIMDDGNCVFGALDVDEYNIDIVKLNAVIRELNLPLVTCYTKSGGAHLYLFLAEPTSAKLVREYLASVAVMIGVTVDCIFPKQIKMTPDAFGNWINLPYFGGERVAISDDGTSLASVEDFLAFAADHMVDDLVLPPMHDGPPCLQKLLARGITEGHRNNAMFNIGVYYAKTGLEGVDLDAALGDLNHARFDPFIKNSEMVDIGKSLAKKTYQYTCDREPLASVCNREACLKRKYGIGQDDVIKNRDALPTDAIVLPGGPQSITIAAQDVFAKLTRDGEYVLRGEVVFHANYHTGDVTLIDAEAMRSRIETAGVENGVRQTFSATTRGYKPEIASLSDCKGMLASESANHLPRVRAISKCPIITSDGNVRTWGIQNEVLIMTDDHVFKFVPVDKARDDLLDLLCDYQFRSPADRSRCMAAMITPLLRISGLIGGHAPITVLEADQSHAGKTKLANVIFAMYRDSNPETVVSKDASESGVGGMTEAINDAYLHARNFVFLDNLRTDGAFANMFLESAVTNDGRVRVRVPYAGYKYVDVSRISAVLTANDLVLNRDLANRSNFVFIVKRSDHYKFHDWSGKSLEGHVRENQQHYFNCVASIVRTWITVHGLQSSNEVVEHDFRPWALKMDFICREMLGLEAPFSDYRKIQDAKVDTEAQWFEQWCRAITDPECVLEANKWATGDGISAKGIFESSNDLGLNTPTDTFMKLGFVLRKIVSGREDFIVASRYRMQVVDSKDDKGRDRKAYHVTDITAPETGENY